MENQKKEPNSALESDPVFGWFLILGLSFAMGMIHRSIGIVFLFFALYVGFKPFDPPNGS